MLVASWDPDVVASWTRACIVVPAGPQAVSYLEHVDETLTILVGYFDAVERATIVITAAEILVDFSREGTVSVLVEL